MFGKAAKNLVEVASTALNLATFRYPGFVYGGGVHADCVPVFCMHGVDPEGFEAMLDYLKSNSYRMLHADEYLSVLKGESTASRRSVVLTFDDGWGSLWSVGFPLIKKYDARIVVFLSPGRIEYRDRYRPNIDDLASKILFYYENPIVHKIHADNAKSISSVYTLEKWVDTIHEVVNERSRRHRGILSTHFRSE
jgi:peptidoglycan/xylan/chitin deacetylase (PgdA/CDA1 family)